jgi:hypothetical protein
MLDDVRFALIAIEEARRKVFCNPGHVAALRALVDELGMAGLVTVKGSPYVPLGRPYVIDPTAMQAALNVAFHARPGAWRWV